MNKLKNPDLKQEARKLVQSGIPRKDVSSKLNVKYRTLCLWTEDIDVPRYRDTIKQRSMFEKIKEDGFYIAKGTDDLNTLRILKVKKGIRIVYARNAHIGFLSGRELDALKGLLGHRNKYNIARQKLLEIGRAFGIKDSDKLKKLLKDKQNQDSEPPGQA